MNYEKEITYLLDKLIEILATQISMMTMIQGQRTEILHLKSDIAILKATNAINGIEMKGVIES